MASANSPPRVSPSQRWRREWSYLDNEELGGDVGRQVWLSYGGPTNVTTRDHVAVRCTDCSNVTVFADLRKHRRECIHKAKGCKWTGLCGEHAAHLNGSPSSSNLLQGCEHATISCIYCTTCKPAKRQELKARMAGQLEEKEFRLVFAMIQEASSKWYDVGLEMHIQRKSLDDIRAKCTTNAEACFLAMIMEWLKSSNRNVKSFEALSEILRNVRQHQLADDMEKSTLCRNVFWSEAERLLKGKDGKIKELSNSAKKFSAATARFDRKAAELKLNEQTLKDSIDAMQNESKQIEDLRQRYNIQNLEHDCVGPDAQLFMEGMPLCYQWKRGSEETTLPPDVARKISSSVDEMNMCKRQVFILQDKIRQNKTELECIKIDVSRCKRLLENAIQVAECFKQELERSKVKLMCEKDCNLARDDDHNYTMDEWIHRTFTGAGAIGITAGLVAFFIGPFVPIVAGLSAVTFLGAWVTGFGAGTVGVIRQNLFGLPGSYNTKQCEVYRKYEEIIASIQLASEEVINQCSLYKKLLDVEN